MRLRTLDGLEVRGRRVLLRADLNVPVRDGRISDLSRIERLSPTIRELAERGARLAVCSHFDRPQGRVVASMSLAPVAAALGEVLGRTVAFAPDCVGPDARAVLARLADGEVAVLENTRFHPGEEANDAGFAAALADGHDLYVDDAFSAAHRAHASTEAVAHLLPAYAGRLMQAELEALASALDTPERPVGALVGGAKVSTKLALLGNLVGRVDRLLIGGAMANTFLAAQGHDVGRSLQEAEMHETARAILARAQDAGCSVMLPIDGVVASEFRADPPTRTVPVAAVPAGSMILDIGPATIEAWTAGLAGLRTLVWNGPVGAFETPPFAAGTLALAHQVATLTRAGRLRSVAGGGDTVAALRQAGVLDALTYVSAAGGAFLEWMEGRTLPGVAVLLVM